MQSPILYSELTSLIQNYSFQPRNKVEKQRLHCLAADPYCLDNAIVNCGLRGIGLDSTWRNMNEDFLPLTFLVTENEFGRMVPSEYHKTLQGLTDMFVLLVVSWSLSFRGRSYGHSACLSPGNPSRNRITSQRDRQTI